MAFVHGTDFRALSQLQIKSKHYKLCLGRHLGLDNMYNYI